MKKLMRNEEIDEKLLIMCKNFYKFVKMYQYIYLFIYLKQYLYLSYD